MKLEQSWKDSTLIVLKEEGTIVSLLEYVDDSLVFFNVQAKGYKMIERFADNFGRKNGRKYNAS